MNQRYRNDGVPYLKLNRLQLLAKHQIEKKIAANTYRFETAACICTANDFQKIAEKDRYGLQHPVAVCKGCGLVQAHPKLNAASYAELHQMEYPMLYDGDTDPERNFRDSEYRRGKAAWAFLQAHDIKLRQAAFVVDTNCAAGGVLKAFDEKGLRVKGIGNSEASVNYGRTKGLDLETGTAATLNLNQVPDLLIAARSLQQSTDLKAEVEQLLLHCGPQTLIYVEVPGIKNLDSRKYRLDLLLYLQAANRYHFSLATLTNVFALFGYELAAGNEQVCAVFRKGKAPHTPQNDHDELVKYLARTERQRMMNEFSTKLKQTFRSLVGMD